DRTLSISDQIEAGKKIFQDRTLAGKAIRGKYSGQKFIAYFQAYTNTYAPVSRLSALFTEAILHPDIAVLSIGTRP
ncbi:hypothetical protein QIG69_27625, partial [Klebsiella pneumoniae]|nr:hypothetical protein [Klebsiella pneumoniae]